MVVVKGSQKETNIFLTFSLFFTLLILPKNGEASIGHESHVSEHQPAFRSIAETRKLFTEQAEKDQEDKRNEDGSVEEPLGWNRFFTPIKITESKEHPPIIQDIYINPYEAGQINKRSDSNAKESTTKKGNTWYQSLSRRDSSEKGQTPDFWLRSRKDFWLRSRKSLRSNHRRHPVLWSRIKDFSSFGFPIMKDSRNEIWARSREGEPLWIMLKTYDPKVVQMYTNIMEMGIKFRKDMKNIKFIQPGETDEQWIRALASDIVHPETFDFSS